MREVEKSAMYRIVFALYSMQQYGGMEWIERYRMQRYRIGREEGGMVKGREEKKRRRKYIGKSREINNQKPLHGATALPR
jgi:hypothetical protein